MSTDEAEVKERKKYLTGGNGYIGAVLWLAMAGFLLSWAFPLSYSAWALANSVFCGLVATLAVARAVAAVLREWNAAVIVSEAGVTARNWRNAEKSISWGEIMAVRYSGAWRTVLSLEVVNEIGQQCRERIAFSLGHSENIVELIEVIVRRLGLSEVANPPRGFFTLKYGPPDTVWR